MPTNTVPFFGQAVATSPFGLVWADPSSLPQAFAVTTGGQNALEAGGVGLDLATVSEYTPSGGTATQWAIRYLVYADATNSAGVLYAVDLRKPTPLVSPVAAQVSSGTVTSLSLCPSLPPTLFDNYGSANLSWIVFHAAGANGMGQQACGALGDTYVGIQPAMSASTAPKSLGMVEPIEALYDTNGAITGFLAINHPTLDSTGNPSTLVPLAQLDASFANVKALGTLLGKGSNVAVNGDFRSLGISAGNVWLYLDTSVLNAVDLASGTTTAITGFTLPAGTSVQGRAVFDGTKAYVAFAGTGIGSQILQIDTMTKAVTATQTLDAAGAGGITLVGVTTNNLVYVMNDGSAIKSVVKSGLTPTTSLASLTATQHIDSLMGPNGSSGPPVAFLVGDTLYFTVADTSASGATGFAKQAFYVNFAGNSTATAVASSVSAVLGVVAPASIPTSGPFTNAGVLVLTGGANGSTAGQAVFASASVGSSLGLYGTGGTLSTAIGAFTTTNPGNNNMPRVNPITGVALNGPAQAGMPATIETYGPDGAGAVGNDIAVFASDASIPLNAGSEISGFLAHAKRPR